MNCNIFLWMLPFVPFVKILMHLLLSNAMWIRNNKVIERGVNMIFHSFSHLSLVVRKIVSRSVWYNCKNYRKNNWYNYRNTWNILIPKTYPSTKIPTRIKNYSKYFELIQMAFCNTWKRELCFQDCHECWNIVNIKKILKQIKITKINSCVRFFNLLVIGYLANIQNNYALDATTGPTPNLCYEKKNRIHSNIQIKCAYKWAINKMIYTNLAIKK